MLLLTVVDVNGKDQDLGGGSAMYLLPCKWQHLLRL